MIVCLNAILKFKIFYFRFIFLNESQICSFTLTVFSFVLKLPHTLFFFLSNLILPKIKFTPSVFNFLPIFLTQLEEYLEAGLRTPALFPPRMLVFC